MSQAVILHGIFADEPNVRLRNIEERTRALETSIGLDRQRFSRRDDADTVFSTPSWSTGRNVLPIDVPLNGWLTVSVQVDWQLTSLGSGTRTIELGISLSDSSDPLFAGIPLISMPTPSVVGAPTRQSFDMFRHRPYVAGVQNLALHGRSSSSGGTPSGVQINWTRVLVEVS